MSVDFDVVIVGGGFSGIWALQRLREKGFKVRGIEKSAGLGGVWLTNCYPGARTDSEQPYYQIFDQDLIDGWTWSEKFPSQEEIIDYFAYVDLRWQISKDFNFSIEVIGAHLNTNNTIWNIKLSNNRTITARWFICAVGFASQISTPPVLQNEPFQGQMYHSGQWPQNEAIDWDSRTVSVIGTGSSAIQIIQEIAPTVKHLTVYQRSPVIAFPKVFAPSSAAIEPVRSKEHHKEASRNSKVSFSGFPLAFRAEKTMEVEEKERYAHYAHCLRMGNWSFLLSAFEDSWSDRKANKDMYDFWARTTRSRIKDPRKRDMLVPLTTSYPIGMKRPCLEDGYYEVFNQTNVDLVDTSKCPLIEITRCGIRVGETTRKTDLIIWATGFDARASTLVRINIQGTNGSSLRSAWKDGAHSHLGMALKSFPNFFYLYGPQSALLRVNAPSVIEAQVDWLCKTLSSARSLNIVSLEATAAAEEAWQEKITQPWRRTLYPSTTSWENRALQGGEAEPVWVAGLAAYTDELEACKAPAFDGFRAKYVRPVRSAEGVENSCPGH